MNDYDMRKRRQDGFSWLGIILILLLLAVGIGYAAYNLFFIPAPIVKGIEGFDYLSAKKTVNLTCENTASVDLTIYQNGKKIVLLKDTPETGLKEYSLEIKPKDLGLNDGKGITTVTARAGIFKKVQYNVETVIDTVPPAIDVLKATQFVDQGGAGAALFKAEGADSVYVRLEDKTFAAFRMKTDQEASAKGAEVKSRSNNNVAADYVVLFPAPHDIKAGSVFYAVAEDLAGNQNIKALPTKLKTINYSESTINISDEFINTVVASILNEVNIADPEGAFKKVNEELRAKSIKTLIDISRKTETSMLWKDSFIQLSNSQVMARYGDKRTYRYKDKVISKSVHLGYDLASYSHAPVAASNSGFVRFAGDLSIYGNTIIIDHGLGLMSLYGHLSIITVKEGQQVEKGDIIAKTGSTGLAGGDHLHFGIIVQGYEVSPLYWWDQHWIQVNILDTLSG